MELIQEKLAEEIISLHKKNSGLLNWYGIGSHIKMSDENRTVIKQTLIDKGLIKSTNQGFTQETILTESGRAFEGFEKERQKLNSDQTRQKEISELTLRKLKLEQFPTKFWWLILILTSVLSLSLTIITLIIQHKYFSN